MTSRSVLLAAALSSALLAPATAQSATVALNKTCYAEGEIASFTGGGFTGTSFSFSYPATISGTNAAFSGQFQAPVQPDNRVTAVTTQTFTITDNLGGTTSANFQLVNIAVSAGTSLKSPKKKRTWEFSGFTVGQPIYGHFRKKGKKASDYKFGVASAPCGRLTKKAPGLPKVKKIKSGKYDVQFDSSPTYNKATRPAFVTTIRVFKTFK